MPPLTARAVSMALLGGVAIVLFLSQGFLMWAGFIGWAAFIEAGGDGAAFKKSVSGNIFGALVAWAALLAAVSVSVPVGGWLWMPRTGLAVAISLFVLVYASRLELLSRVSASLLGYAAVFGAATLAVAEVTGPERLTGLHAYNPLLVAVISMVGGAVFGLASGKLAEAMTKK